MVEQLPKDWKWVKLGEVCKIIMGQSPPSESYNKNGIGLPFFQGKAEFTELHPLVEKWCDSPNKIAEPSDILLSVRAPVGTTNIANQKCCIGRGLAAIRFENYKYVYYFLKSKQQELDSKGTGTTFQAISGETIRETQFPFAPKPTQLAIVSKIEELFSEIENGIKSLFTAKEQLKTYRQSVLKWAFEGKLTRSELGLNGLIDDRIEEGEKDTNNKILKSFNPTNPNSDKGELPEGWKWVLINEIGKIKGGKRLPPKHKYSEEPTDFVYIMAGNLKDGTVRNKPTFIKEETYNALTNCEVTGGEVYITIVGACIGDAGIIPENIGKSILTENAAKIIELKETYNKYLALWINSTICQSNIKSKILSATLGKLALNRIGTLEVPLAPINEQHAIVEAIESRLSVADKMEEGITQSLQQAEALKQSILKKAFDGRLVN